MKSRSEYQKSVLPSGLRIVTEQVPSARSVAFGVWIDTGSRDETREVNGITHFIEHMLFKGTKTRNAREIASSLESLGGSLNAFTSREQTCFHAVVLDEHTPQAVDVISDIVMNSTLSPVNLEREKLVVMEEIREVDETPSDLIHDLFSNCFWRGQALGWPIMGSIRNIKSMTRGGLLKHLRNHYRAGRVVISAAGNISHQRLLKLVRGRFEFASGGRGQEKAVSSPDRFLLKSYQKKGNQTHLCIGFPGVSFSSPERNVLLALHAYLGGGMSSVLFQKIREDKGIAYTVYTFPDFYRDGGLLGIYLAADKKKVPSAIDIVLRELRKVKRERLSTDKLFKVKEQIKGNMTLSLESTMSRMSRLARQEIMIGRRISIDESLRAIDRITADDIIEIARRILRHDIMTVTSLGSAHEDEMAAVDWKL
ncbi:Uncharacterized zinc protease YmxG [Candidatus Zixiibacteriota bacterium]|nr:Uncharacterized zinc protease YmxG [candidate division Zixibacteria bacterium]